MDQKTLLALEALQRLAQKARQRGDTLVADRYEAHLREIAESVRGPVKVTMRERIAEREIVVEVAA